MKRKMFVLAAVLSIFISLGISGGEVNAAWYTCTVDSSGPAGGNVMVQLTDTAATPAFTAKWFATSNTNVTGTNRIFAAVLTAMSLEKTVLIAVTDLVPTYPVILNLYLNK